MSNSKGSKLCQEALIDKIKRCLNWECVGNIIVAVKVRTKWNSNKYSVTIFR